MFYEFMRVCGGCLSAKTLYFPSKCHLRVTKFCDNADDQNKTNGKQINAAQPKKLMAQKIKKTGLNAHFSSGGVAWESPTRGSISPLKNGSRCSPGDLSVGLKCSTGKVDGSRAAHMAWRYGPAWERCRINTPPRRMVRQTANIRQLLMVI